ncbi:hypothetical protein SAY86_021231 [Trapa natans]|uniref:SANTA domain-containing protein n=1 Tax=Trapa natans TaxID=22666 RepID=A0AAN7M9E0_TRANT|nr:hypothetical protein SAY86_021231 [Trapa natans]
MIDGSVKRAIRVFKSAPIIKVNDFYSLETADNVCVILRGLVNKSLSSENGFPGEVCKHFVFGFPVNWKKFVTEQGKSSPCKTPRAQGIPYKQDQKSSREHKKFKKENQLCDRTKNNSTDSAKDYIEVDLPETVEEDRSIPVEKDLTSTCNHKNSESTRQPNVRTRNNCAAESAHSYLGSNHLRDDMKDPEEGSSSAHSVKSKSSPYDHKDHPRNDMEGTQEVPSSAPTFDQGTLCKPRNVKEGKERCAMMSKCAKKCINANCTNDGLKETRAEPSSTSSLSQPRRSSQYQMVSAKEDAAKSKATAGVIPNTQGIIMTPDSFKRSRSGRILLPKLAYWMNEVPIYDANRMVAGVQCPTKIVDSRDNEKVSSRK